MPLPPILFVVIIGIYTVDYSDSLLWQGSIQNLRNTPTITVTDNDCCLDTFMGDFHSLMACKGYIYGECYNVISSLICHKHSVTVTSPYLFALYQYVADSVSAISETPYQLVNNIIECML